MTFPVGTPAWRFNSGAGGYSWPEDIAGNQQQTDRTNNTNRSMSSPREIIAAIAESTNARIKSPCAIMLADCPYETI